MATPETIGTATCPNCSTLVYVKKNRGGLPYYRCGKCDHEGREHSSFGTRLFMAKVTRGEFDEDAAPPAGNPGEKQEMTAAEKAAAGNRQGAAEAAAANASKSRFSTLLGGK